MHLSVLFDLLLGQLEGLVQVPLFVVPLFLFVLELGLV